VSRSATWTTLVTKTVTAEAGANMAMVAAPDGLTELDCARVSHPRKERC